MTDNSESVAIRQLHHGAAATSSSKGIITIPSPGDNDSSEIAYASHAILNIAHRGQATLLGQEKREPIWNVHQTLRTESKGSETANSTVATSTAKRVISCLALVHSTSSSANDATTILCGFSDGTITSWKRTDQTWQESILMAATDADCDGRAITDIAGTYIAPTILQVVTCSSGGAFQFICSLESSEGSTVQKTTLLHTPTNVVKYHTIPGADLSPAKTLVLIGTSAPRHNKIHVFVVATESDPSVDMQKSLTYCGALIGHEDWITCFDWMHHPQDGCEYLASGSQDARVRLWKFTTAVTSSEGLVPTQRVEDEDDQGNDDDDDEEADNADDEEEMEEGESRLEIVVGNSQTSVFLEALLIGHEERVTAVAWHPDPRPIYGEDLILISSSMDRSIFIWSELSGIWTPISRVGSAGGILGGSVGSSLLGFLNVQLEPHHGRWMVGHGYGGALHFFSSEAGENDRPEFSDEMGVEERAALTPWKAQPCLTGHFDGVTDLCWESCEGDYLLTVGKDQTCRVWAPLPFTPDSPESKVESNAWIEIARPQVHGYDLAAVTSHSSPDHRHLLISGAEEKELRTFDATRSFGRLLEKVVATARNQSDSMSRVDKAYIPSLGLSNKATASEGAEMDDVMGGSESSTQLPLERDLGAVSLWPEVQKLYGHNTELARLTSTLAAKSAMKLDSSKACQKSALVASSAKARDVEAACIRLWNVPENRCAQVLTGGHRSTVTAMSFSPDERFLVTSGKDRRLCVWERPQLQDADSSWGEFALAQAVDSAHKRIVWSVHFCPFESSVFASASRDGLIRVWKLASSEGSTSLQELVQFCPKVCGSGGKPEAVTSIAFAPLATASGADAILSLGLENGMIEIWKVPVSNDAPVPTLLQCLPSEMSHIRAVTKLAWRPRRDAAPAEGNEMVLASCADDHGCRIFAITLEKTS